MSVPNYTVILLLLAVHFSIQRSTPESPTYRAAVVEYGPTEYHDDYQRAMDESAEKYTRYIKEASRKDVDVIVFPEGGLNMLHFPLRSEASHRATFIPNPSEKFIPCINDSIRVIGALKKLSCVARENQIYVAFNILEKEECEGSYCSSDGLLVYLSNVALDRNGAIVLRSRKNHQFDVNAWFNSTETVELSIFESDFGVRFGSFVCYDIMFESPPFNLTRQFNVTDFVYPGGWFVALPFTSTVQMQSSWAYAEDVNLIAAGYNRVRTGHSGSGIFAGRQGILAAVQPLDPCNEMLIADVPKKNRKNTSNQIQQHQRTDHPEITNTHVRQTQYRRSRDIKNLAYGIESFENYVTKVISQTGYSEETLVTNDVTCDFKVNLTRSNPPITYRLVAYDGILVANAKNLLGTSTCAIVQCVNETLKSCGHFEDTPTTFDFIEVKATYAVDERVFFAPNTLGTNMLPITGWTFDHHRHNGKYTASILLTTPAQNLVAFGVRGRNFVRDQITI